MNRGKISKELDEFISYDDGWAGPDTCAISQEIYEHAKFLIDALSDEYLDKISDMYMNYHGTISIDWERNPEERVQGKMRENYATLEIGTNGSTFYHVVDGEFRRVEAQDNVVLEENVDKLKGFIDEVFGNNIP